MNIEPAPAPTHSNNRQSMNRLLHLTHRHQSFTSKIVNKIYSTDKVYVVCGGSRGIGACLAKLLVNENPYCKVVALSRHMSNDSELHALISSNTDRVEWFPTDLASQESIDRACRLINSKYHKIDYLFNIAAVLSDEKGPERSLGDLDRDWMRKSFEVTTTQYLVAHSHLG
jgi:NAD(P)-dependent dehydrogenase (short-subunit alcohol dehydrogenase family)